MFAQARLALELPTSMLSAREVLGLAALAEARGIGTIWLAEGGRDIISLVGALSQTTTHIRIATGPIDTWSRTPYLIAMTAASSQELTAGRFVLGLSPGYTQAVRTQHGLTLTDLDDAPARVAEILRVVRALLEGATVTLDGRFVHVVGARLPNDQPVDVPIYLNARQGKMLEIAGELADGVILSIATPEWVKGYAIPRVSAGATRVGRALSGIHIAYHPIMCLSSNESAALAAAREAVSRYFLNDEVISLLRNYGYPDAMTTVVAAREKGQRPTVPDELVRAITVLGTPEAVIEQLGAFEAAGVDSMIIRPYPVGGESAYEAASRVIDQLMS